jgi:hypothetical protein
MLPFACLSPFLGGARSHTSSICWVRGSNKSKRKSRNWSQMEDLALGRTFQPLLVSMYMCKNRLAPVPLLISMFGGCKEPHFDHYTGIFYLYHGVGLGCDLRHSACDMIWMRLESLNVPHSSMWHDLAFMVPVSSMCEDPVLKMFLIRYMCWHMHCTIFWIFIHLKPTYEVGHATVFTNQVGHATFIN